MRGIGYDTTHCTGQGCVLKPKCLRYLSKHNPHGQTFFTDPPFKGDTCEYFISITPPCVGHDKEDDKV